MVSRETDDNRQRTGQEPGAAVPLMPIRGHPSGRGSQALRTAFLGRDEAGLEAPNSGICKMKEPSELVSLYLGKRSETCPGAQRESAALDPTLVSSLSNWGGCQHSRDGKRL